MTAIMTKMMPFYEEIMKVFCTDNMTNNIQYKVTSHYPIMSGGATAKSLEGVVIGMSFTIGIPSISQWKEFTGGGSGVVLKVRSQRVWGTFAPPQFGLGQISVWGMGQSPQKLKQNVKLKYNF